MNKYPETRNMLARLSLLTGIPCVTDGLADHPAKRAEWSNARKAYVSVATGEPVTCIALHEGGVALHVNGDSGIRMFLVNPCTRKELAEAVWAYERLTDGVAAAREAQ